MSLTEAAAELGVSPRTLRLAAEQGDVGAEHPLPDGPWVFNRTALRAGGAVALAARVRLRSGTRNAGRSPEGADPAQGVDASTSPVVHSLSL